MMTHPWIAAELVAQHRADLIAEANHRRLLRRKTDHRRRPSYLVPPEAIRAPDEVPCCA
jgi:hypothetical protein